jgi:hypothetical protein
VLAHERHEVGLLLHVGQVALEQQVAGFQEVALLGQLLDGVAAVQQFALVTVDVGDGAVARGRAQEARVVGELAGLRVKLADVDHIRPDAALVDGQVHARAAVGLKDSVAFTSEGVIAVAPFFSSLGGRWLAHQRQHLVYFGHIHLALWLLAGQQQVQQIVVGQVHQGFNPCGLPCCQRLLVTAEEAFDEQVVFQQAAAAAPLSLLSSRSPSRSSFIWPGAPSAP